jgi:hypothetical protein
VQIYNNKEYGGYLPIESLVTNRKSHYFEFNDKATVLLNCGRTCFYVAARSAKIKKIYIPYFTCEETVQPFKDLKIPFSYYRLNKELLPEDINLKKNEYILWTNYYGNAPEKTILEINDKYSGQLIVDNCHAFFCPPLSNAFNCYSARKFIGVSDGAYLVTDLEIDLNIDDLEKDISSPFMEHLFKQVEKGTNYAYQLSLRNEKRLEGNYKLMSLTSEKILSQVDYEEIKRIRNQNFDSIHSCLSKFNNFPINRESKTHMYYPFKYKDLDLREKLLKNKVYSPVWWRHVVDMVGKKSIESQYALETVLLPIDQRYEKKDIKALSSLVLRLIES